MTDPAPAPTTSSPLPAQTVFGAAEKLIVSDIEHPFVTIEELIKAIKADEVKVKAEAVKWYKEAIVAVGSRVFYLGSGALTMFVALRVL